MNKKVFIIDQDANILYSLQSQLSEAGFKVKADHSFCDIEIIVQKLCEFEPELLILDINHSYWDWKKLLHEIRNADNLKEIFIIIYFSNKEDKKFLNFGANYFFSKDDLSLDEFIKKIINIENKIIKK